ncbi:MAG: pilus assembly protein [Alphaproteobacteria bacterium]|nr:pilus assembly protein [Alphaproteobacteria bacterium]MBV9693325.1 pilus assembly protein [Alphaproteobacteria bacterium]
MLRRMGTAGMAAVEFALVLPALLALVFGSIEVTNILIVRSDVANLTSSAADLVAQESTVSDADMTNVFNALTALVFPYSTTGAKIVITSVIDDGHGGGKVAWSDAYNGTARTVGTSVTVPTGLITAGGSTVMAEVTYNYATPSSYLIKVPVSMSNTFYSHPRRVAQIARTHP